MKRADLQPEFYSRMWDNCCNTLGILFWYIPVARQSELWHDWLGLYSAGGEL